MPAASIIFRSPTLASLTARDRFPGAGEQALDGGELGCADRLLVGQPVTLAGDRVQNERLRGGAELLGLRLDGAAASAELRNVRIDRDARPLLRRVGVGVGVRVLTGVF